MVAEMKLFSLKMRPMVAISLSKFWSLEITQLLVSASSWPNSVSASLASKPIHLLSSSSTIFSIKSSLKMGVAAESLVREFSRLESLMKKDLPSRAERLKSMGTSPRSSILMVAERSPLLESFLESDLTSNLISAVLTNSSSSSLIVPLVANLLGASGLRDLATALVTIWVGVRARAL